MYSGYHIRLVQFGLRAIIDGEMAASRDSTVSIYADARGGIWMVSGEGARGSSG